MCLQADFLGKVGRQDAVLLLVWMNYWRVVSVRIPGWGGLQMRGGRNVGCDRENNIQWRRS
jgi:hypothetical protein